MAKELHFDASATDWLDHPPEDRPHFLKFSAWDDDGQQVRIITDRYGEGLWHRVKTPTGVDYHQVAGTMQYRLPATAKGVRSKLTRVYGV